MCRMLVGLPGHRETFLMPCENHEALESLLKEMSKDGAKWPQEPLAFDLWSPEPPLVVDGKKMTFVSMERCEELVKALEVAAIPKTEPAPVAPAPAPA